MRIIATLGLILMLCSCYNALVRLNPVAGARSVVTYGPPTLSHDLASLRWLTTHGNPTADQVLATLGEPSLTRVCELEYSYFRLDQTFFRGDIQFAHDLDPRFCNLVPEYRTIRVLFDDAGVVTDIETPFVP